MCSFTLFLCGGEIYDIVEVPFLSLSLFFTSTNFTFKPLIHSVVDAVRPGTNRKPAADTMFSLPIEVKMKYRQLEITSDKYC